MELKGPDSWTLTGIIRWLCTLVLALLITVFLEENIRYFYEKKQWNTFLLDWIEEMPKFNGLYSSYAFWFFFGLSAGISISLWLARWYPERRPISPAQPSQPQFRVVPLAVHQPPTVSPSLAPPERPSIAASYADYMNRSLREIRNILEENVRDSTTVPGCLGGWPLRHRDINLLSR